MSKDNTLLEFCPKCQTLLLTEKYENDVLLKCPNCEYSRPIAGLHTIHSNKFKGSGTTTNVPFATIYDSAVKRTTRVPCQNTTCPSLDQTRWGSNTDRGIKVEPNVMISTIYNADRITTYICRVCGKIFGP
jgi:DNA-directed RNA polymerase subunit M/transcription elongation factor TFIIS